MRYIIPLIFLLVFLFTPLRVFAQEISGGIAVSPAYVDVEVQDPAERKEFEITYKNNGSEQIELEIFPINFVQTNERGAIGFLGQESGSYKYGLSSFLSFETNSLQLEPGETKSLTAIVTNRQDLSPGGHYAAIIGRVVIDDSSISSITTKIAPAVSVLVYLVKKGGENYNLSLKSVDWPKSPIVFNIPSTIVLTFQNEGNTHLTPFGTVMINDMFGREVYKGFLNDSSFKVLPSSRRVIPGYLTRLKTLVPISFMAMEIKGTDFGKNTNFIFRESFVYVNPWVSIIFIGLIPAILVWKKRAKIKKNKS